MPIACSYLKLTKTTSIVKSPNRKRNQQRKNLIAVQQSFFVEFIFPPAFILLILHSRPHVQIGQAKRRIDKGKRSNTKPYISHFRRTCTGLHLL
ncbi:hypothetical protein BDW69DRAFT_55330 [Aspergillus filifer]